MMSDAITIRAARADDAEALAAFNRGIALETEGLALRPEVVLAGVRAVFDEPSRGFYVVAEAAGEASVEVVAALMITKEWSDWRCGEFWWIQSVYVAREWRRRGVYRRLYDYVRELATGDAHCCGFRLYVERENAAAKATYAAVGMHATGYEVYEEAGGPTAGVG